MRRAEEKPLFWRRFPLPSPLLPPPAPHPVSERRLTAGDVRGELLDGDGLPRVEEVVHLAQGEVLAARRGGGGGRRRGRGGGGRGCRGLVVVGGGGGGRGVAAAGAAAAASAAAAAFVAGGGGGRAVLEVGPPGLVGSLLELVEHADGSVLPDPVADLLRVDPHGQLGREDGVDEVGREAAALAGLGDDGVHFAVDADASVTRALQERRGGKLVSATTIAK